MTPTPIEVVSEVIYPIDLVTDGNDLYISEDLGLKVSKFTIATLSTNNYSTSSPPKVFPNPSNKSITIHGLTKKEKYKIYNTIGREMNSGSINNNDKIDIQHLTNGLYFLKFDNGNTIKFIKE